MTGKCVGGLNLAWTGKCSVKYAILKWIKVFYRVCVIRGDCESRRTCKQMASIRIPDNSTRFDRNFSCLLQAILQNIVHSYSLLVCHDDLEARRMKC